MNVSVSFQNEEVTYFVEGFEFAQDQEKVYDGRTSEELKGKQFSQGYTSFDEAINKYKELREKGWECVYLAIRTKKRRGVIVNAASYGVRVDIDFGEYFDELSELLTRMDFLLKQIKFDVRSLKAMEE